MCRPNGRPSLTRLPATRSLLHDRRTDQLMPGRRGGVADLTPLDLPLKADQGCLSAKPGSVRSCRSRAGALESGAELPTTHDLLLHTTAQKRDSFPKYEHITAGRA